ncbi:MAG: hypothetical protein R3F31_19630 [Verrucomicrobiales bacterium]
MKTSYYIGLDVHKDSIAVAFTKAGERKEPTYFGECGGSVLAAEAACGVSPPSSGPFPRPESLLRGRPLLVSSSPGVPPPRARVRRHVALPE